jgi:diphthamide biosynthesis methyltransferase
MDIMEYTHMFMELTQQLLTLATHTYMVLTPTHTLTATTHMSLVCLPKKHVVAKREAEGDSAFYYNTYGYPHHTGYTGYNFYNRFPYTHNFYYGK